MYIPVSTPWGKPQHVKLSDNGVIWFSTASHGGYYVSPSLMDKMPPVLRALGGGGAGIDGLWFEEDCAWCAVVLAFPDIDPEAIEPATRTMRNWFPDQYEAYTGNIIPPGESLVKDRRTFFAEHENDWVVTAAVMSETPGMVKCWAWLGGKRNRGVERQFLVSEKEYDARPSNGFVIDLKKHTSIEL